MLQAIALDGVGPEQGKAIGECFHTIQWLIIVVFPFQTVAMTDTVGIPRRQCSLPNRPGLVLSKTSGTLLQTTMIFQMSITTEAIMQQLQHFVCPLHQEDFFNLEHHENVHPPQHAGMTPGYNSECKLTSFRVLLESEIVVGAVRRPQNRN